MGHTVNSRSSKKSYRDKRVKNAPKDWLIFENTHEAIVDPETWPLAQQVKRAVRRTDTTGVANPLTGLVFYTPAIVNHDKRMSEFHKL